MMYLLMEDEVHGSLSMQQVNVGDTGTALRSILITSTTALLVSSHDSVHFTFIHCLLVSVEVIFLLSTNS